MRYGTELSRFLRYFLPTFTLHNHFKAGTRRYKGLKETPAEEDFVVNDHCSNLPIKISVAIKNHKDNFPTIYGLPKLHKIPCATCK